MINTRFQIYYCQYHKEASKIISCVHWYITHSILYFGKLAFCIKLTFLNKILHKVISISSLFSFFLIFQELQWVLYFKNVFCTFSAKILNLKKNHFLIIFWIEIILFTVGFTIQRSRFEQFVVTFFR